MRVVIAIALLALSGCKPSDDPELTKAKALVARQLRDPSSAQFRDVEKCYGHPAMFTGSVNGKNSFGAYTGFESFFVVGGTAFMIGSFPFDAVNEKDRAYFAHLATVCQKGGNPDLGNFYGMTDQ